MEYTMKILFSPINMYHKGSSISLINYAINAVDTVSMSTLSPLKVASQSSIIVVVKNKFYIFSYQKKNPQISPIFCLRFVDMKEKKFVPQFSALKKRAKVETLLKFPLS